MDKSVQPETSCAIKDLSKHMCTLHAQGQTQCIADLSNRPVVKCRYCGASANSLKNICAADFLGRVDS